MEVKVKKTTWGVVKEKYISGFKRLKYNTWSYYKMKWGKILFPHTFYVTPIYLKKKDITYFVIVDVGFIDLFNHPLDSDECIVLRYPGKITELDNVKDDDVFKATFEELYEAKEKSLDTKNEEA